ncbi:YagK/YfjJ domain-containing protein [Agarivorans litoreus]|uniref:YagK/YfjJ domain-containing protein n=1 Tax=Agarivorans litoreus TaxID=1510455 RepID=UPI001C7DD1BF
MTSNGLYRVITYKDLHWWVQGNHGGLNLSAIKRIVDQLEAMLSHHNKVLVLRFDLHCKSYSPDNRELSKFLKQLKIKLKAKYGFVRIGYVCCRERAKANAQHYHLALFLDGNKVNYPSKICEMIECTWNQGSVYFPKNRYYKLTRDDFNPILETVFRLSYLAKTRSKEGTLPQTKKHLSSRIQRGPRFRFKN